MTEAFLSYSRRNKTFVQKLHHELTATHERDIWVDWEDIPPTADWSREIEVAIESANNFVFIISPDSLASTYCAQELEYALAQNKRLIPVLHQQVSDASDMPESLAVHNWIFLREGDDFEDGLRLLLQAMDTDLAHVRIHTNLLLRAKEWEANQHDGSYLLRGTVLHEAESWLSSSGQNTPPPTALHARHIVSSRKASVSRQRITLGAVTLGLVAAIVLAALAGVQWVRADSQAEIARSRQLAAQSLNELDSGRLDISLLLGLEASRIRETLEAQSSLLAGLEQTPRLLTFLRDHTESVSAVAFSPEGDTLASGSVDGSVFFWSVGDERPRSRLFAELESDILSLAFNPDGNNIAVASAGISGVNAIRLFDVASGQIIGDPFSGHQGNITQLAFSPDGQILASASRDNTIRLWDVASGEALGEPLAQHNDWVLDIAFSPDGQTLASASRDNTIMLWDLVKNEVAGAPLKGHSDWVTSIAFSPDGQILASGSNDDTIILWDVATRVPRSEVLTEHQNDVLSIAFHPGGELLASASSDERVILWNIAGRRPEAIPLAGHDGEIGTLAFSPDGRMLASGDLASTIILWDVEARQRLGQIVNTPDRVWSVAISRTDPIVAAGNGDGSIQLADLSSGTTIGNPLAAHEGAVQAVAFSPDGQILVSGGRDNAIILHDMASYQQIAELNFHSDWVFSLAFSPDGQILASGGRDNQIVLWDTQTNQPIGEPLAGHSNAVRSLAFSPDGSLLASASDDATIILWDVATRQPSGQPLEGHSAGVRSLAFSPNSRLLASGGADRNVILWDLENRRRTGLPLTDHTGAVNSVMFRANSETLASSSDDRTIILWDVQARQPIGEPLVGHADRVNDLAFGLNDARLVSASADRTLILWDLEVSAWTQRACRIANRNLTLEEWEQYFRDEPFRATCSAFL